MPKHPPDDTTTIADLIKESTNQTTITDLYDEHDNL